MPARNDERETHEGSLYRIFIAHASEDTAFADNIMQALKRVKEFAPYLAKDFPSYGLSFIEKIQNAIEASHFMIVILSENSVLNQWVNQELGFACAIRKIKKKLSIIPIWKSNVPLKGFITKDTTELLDSEKQELEILIANIFRHIRATIPYGSDKGFFHFTLECPVCKGPEGLPLEVLVPIPALDAIFRSHERKNHFWQCKCSRCGGLLGFHILTLEQVDT